MNIQVPFDILLTALMPQTTVDSPNFAIAEPSDIWIELTLITRGL